MAGLTGVSSFAKHHAYNNAEHEVTFLQSDISILEHGDMVFVVPEGRIRGDDLSSHPTMSPSKFLLNQQYWTQPFVITSAADLSVKGEHVYEAVPLAAQITLTDQNQLKLITFKPLAVVSKTFCQNTTSSLYRVVQSDLWSTNSTGAGQVVNDTSTGNPKVDRSDSNSSSSQAELEWIVMCKIIDKDGKVEWLNQDYLVEAPEGTVFETVAEVKERQQKEVACKQQQLVLENIMNELAEIQKRAEEDHGKLDTTRKQQLEQNDPRST